MTLNGLSGKWLCAVYMKLFSRWLTLRMMSVGHCLQPNGFHTTTVGVCVGVCLSVCLSVCVSVGVLLFSCLQCDSTRAQYMLQQVCVSITQCYHVRKDHSLLIGLQWELVVFALVVLGFGLAQQILFLGRASWGLGRGSEALVLAFSFEFF